ncbi:unnamed protein product [Coregonus sp. 'balchen']|nr:unnamed protein product [Coregonus sp. 'balchen']
MAAAACSTSKPRKEHLRKSRDSRRRQAALLFLSNISLDGRPVQPLDHGNRDPHRRDGEFLVADIGATVAGMSTASSSSYGTFGNLPTSVSCGAVGNVSPVPRLGVITVPPVLVLPSDSFNDGTTEVFLERRGGSFSSQGNLLSPSGLLTTPLGPRKSSTLLSVQSCNSVTSESGRCRTRNLSGSPRPRPVKKVHFIKNMRQYDTQGSRKERLVQTVSQTDPWVPECSCAVEEKRSTVTMTKELGARLDCAHDHQCYNRVLPPSATDGADGE